MDTTLEGYGAVYDTETVILGLFRERIAPGAFRETVARDDIRSLLNHNPDILLGRTSARTLTVSEDAKGLRYVVRLNAQDPMALGVAARIARRDIAGSSFWFAIDHADDEEWEPAPTRSGLPLRTLKKLRLIDVGPVTLPAYEQTSASVVVRAGVMGTIAARELAQLRIKIARLR
jgi:HK97 family phage prohead protease